MSQTRESEGIEADNEPPQGLKRAMFSRASLRGLIAAVVVPALALAAPAAADAGAIEVVDDHGRAVRLQGPARRIVSLAPHITENLFSAGAGQLVAGAVNHSDYPPAARALRRVGGYDNFDVELILALQPDLVIAWKEGNPFHLVEKLETFGLTVYINEPKRLEDIARDIVRFGALTGAEDQARETARRFTAALSRLRARHAQAEKISVFYQVWPKPLVTATDRQLIGSVIALCGGANIFADLTAPTPQVSQEAVLTRNPDAIITSGMGAARPDWLDRWKRWSFLTAVAHDNLFFVNPELIQRSTVRILSGAQQVCEALQTARNNLGR